ncbi:hypothetical protein Tco_0688000 [Tanacetum coccineum]
MLGRQMELVGDETKIVPLYYHMFDNFEIQFGREEFCLVTGLKFGVEYLADYNDEDEPIPFRRRVFSSSLDGILQLVLLGVKDRRGRVPAERLIPDEIEVVSGVGFIAGLLCGRVSEEVKITSSF